MSTVKTSVINGSVFEVDPAMIRMIKLRLNRRLIQIRSTRVTVTADLLESELTKLIPMIHQKPWYNSLVREIALDKKC